MKWKRYEYVDYTHVTYSMTTSRNIELGEDVISVNVLRSHSVRKYIDISNTLIQNDDKTYSSINHEMYFKKEQYYQLLILLKITLSLHKGDTK